MQYKAPEVDYGFNFKVFGIFFNAIAIGFVFFATPISFILLLIGGIIAALIMCYYDNLRNNTQDIFLYIIYVIGLIINVIVFTLFVDFISGKTIHVPSILFAALLNFGLIPGYALIFLYTMFSNSRLHKKYWQEIESKE